MKGAEKILDFIEKNSRKLLIFGSLNNHETDILEKIKFLKQKNLVFFVERISSIELENRLAKLYLDYKLLGFSLTQEVNLSNATQEINKDIDYLAMGIPLIGNHRIPTKEKIDSGCGVLIEDKVAVEKLLQDELFYKTLSTNCIDYYNRYYSQTIFEKKLIEVVENV